MKTTREWIELWKLDNDGEFESQERLAYLTRFIRGIHENAWISAINSAAEMCGGDSHIEQGVLSLLEPQDKNEPTP